MTERRIVLTPQQFENLSKNRALAQSADAEFKAVLQHVIAGEGISTATYQGLEAKDGMFSLVLQLPDPAPPK